LTISGVTFQRSGATQPGGEAASQAYWVFTDCAYDGGAVNASQFGGNMDGGWIGCDLTNLAASSLAPGTREIRIIRGCSGAAGGSAEGWLFVGNNMSMAAGALAYGTRPASRSIAAFNRANGVSPSVGFWSVASTTGVEGAVLAQNVVEYLSATSGPAARATADAATGDTTNIIIQHNTFAGFFINGRANLFYEDGATARTSKLMSGKGNIHVQINTKGDRFVSNGARVGNWAYLYGVDCDGEFTQFIDADSGGLGSAFAQEYPGLNASIGTSATVRNDPLFVDYEAVTSGPTAGAGGGNYALQSGSPAKGRAPALIRFDAAGNLRSLVTSAGAYE
jgi:hypothetical protein